MLSLNNQSQNATLYDPIHTTFLKSQQLESPTPSEKRFTVDRGQGRERGLEVAIKGYHKGSLERTRFSILICDDGYMNLYM